MRFLYLLIPTVLLLSCSKQICPLKNGRIYENKYLDPYSMTDPNNYIIITSEFPEVYSVSGGEVISIINIPVNRKAVLIKIKDKTQKEYFYVYSGLESVNFNKGDNVQKKDVLGKLMFNGETYELEFQYREHSKKINPRNCIKCKQIEVTEIN